MLIMHRKYSQPSIDPSTALTIDEHVVKFSYKLFLRPWFTMNKHNFISVEYNNIMHERKEKQNNGTPIFCLDGHTITQCNANQ